MSFIVSFIKKIVNSLCLIYTINVIIGTTSVFIPINIFSILLIAYLGLPGVILFLILIFVL